MLQNDPHRIFDTVVPKLSPSPLRRVSPLLDSLRKNGANVGNIRYDLMYDDDPLLMLTESWNDEIINLCIQQDFGGQLKFSNGFWEEEVRQMFGGSQWKSMSMLEMFTAVYVALSKHIASYSYDWVDDDTVFPISPTWLKFSPNVCNFMINVQFSF